MKNNLPTKIQVQQWLNDINSDNSADSKKENLRDHLITLFGSLSKAQGYADD
jgi:hypothetical protein